MQFPKNAYKVIIHEHYFDDPKNSRVNDNKILVPKDDSLSLKHGIELNSNSIICSYLVHF